MIAADLTMIKTKVTIKYVMCIKPNNIPVELPEARSKTGSDPYSLSLLDLIIHLRCCSEDLQIYYI